MNLDEMKLGLWNSLGNGLGISGGAGVTPPAQPTGLSATPITTARIDLAWTDNATNETAYKVYRSTDGVSYAQVGTDLAADANSYSDTTAEDGVPYWYQVAAVNSAGETLSDAVTTNTLLLTLTSYWKLDEVSDGSAPVTRVATVGGMDMTDVNTVASAAGKISNGANLIANDSTNLNHANNAILQMGNIDFTIAFWCKPGGLSGFPTIISKDNVSATRDYAILIGYPNAEKFGFQVVTGAGPQNLGSATVLATGNWYFVVAWHDAVADMMYLQINNGTPAEQATGGALSAASTNSFMFGCGLTTPGETPLNHFLGVLDEVGMWKRVLTADERTSLYNGGAGLPHPF